VSVLQCQVEVEVAVDVGGVVWVVRIVVVVVVVAHHRGRGSSRLVKSMSSRDNVLREVEHVLRRVGGSHQISRVKVEVVEHLVRGLASQLELHLGQQSHDLVNIGTLLEQREQCWQGLQSSVSRIVRSGRDWWSSFLLSVMDEVTSRSVRAEADRVESSAEFRLVFGVS